ncbi:aldehyde dehydrogenase family protein [Variovorax sp. LARHSF232]
MRQALKFLINGQWVDPVEPNLLAVISPVTEEVYGNVALGSGIDVDHAVAAAVKAQHAFSLTTREDRLSILAAFFAEYEKNEGRLVDIVVDELGCTAKFAREFQVNIGKAHLHSTISALRILEFQTAVGSACVVREPIGVSALITPWNFPLGLVISKVAAALAAGCCSVLKPSELTPFTATAVAEIAVTAGVPAGVFNLIFGLGEEVGEHLTSHPDVRMVSITGSTAAGVRVAKAAAATVKRVHQELGGKSASIILEDADLDTAIEKSISAAFRNSGQSCSAPTRLLVPRSLLSEVEARAKSFVETFKVGGPDVPGATHGPVISKRQYDSIQSYIGSAIEEGANVLTGGQGRPEGLNVGFFVRPTVVSDVSENMKVAKEEIFGPVLVIIPYDSVADAVAIANSTEYGLAAYVQSASLEKAREISRLLHAGTVHINFPPFQNNVPFGGWKQSGNGREYGRWGIEEYLESKTITGYDA